MEQMTKTAAECAVVIAQMARQTCERDTLKAAKAFITWKIENDADALTVKDELTELFAATLENGIKKNFIQACQNIETKAAAIAAEYWSEARAQRVINKCAAEGLAGVTREMVDNTKVARADRYYSVQDCVFELLDAADEDGDKKHELRRYYTYTRAWYRAPETEEERAKYGNRVPEAGPETVCDTYLTWADAKRQCAEYNGNLPEDNIYSVKMEFEEE